ncbi:hypothetical protein JHK82_047812 [Glycine max]|nr:hypothetical protein JHK82_047812 [Glycine max]
MQSIFLGEKRKRKKRSRCNAPPKKGIDLSSTIILPELSIIVCNKKYGEQHKD